MLADHPLGTPPRDRLEVVGALAPQHRGREPAGVVEPAVRTRQQVLDRVGGEEGGVGAVPVGGVGDGLGAVLAELRDSAVVVRVGPRARGAVEPVVLVDQRELPQPAHAGACERAEAACQRALTGEEDFTTIAWELSEGPSAPNGGDLGWVTKDALIGPLAEAIFALEPGEISAVVRSRFGFHVATVTERRPPETVSLDDASDQIETVLRQKKASDTVGELLATLVEKADVENLLGGGPATSGTGTAID